MTQAPTASTRQSASSSIPGWANRRQGRDHLPDHPSHRNGLEGEYALANEIARQFPDHTVIDFGRKAGERGADVISVDRDGMVTLWDSKWRGRIPRSVLADGRIRRRNHLRVLGSTRKQSIRTAVASGRLSPEAGAKACENVKDGNLTIVTVGTDSARNGVIEQILGGKRAIVHPQRRP